MTLVIFFNVKFEKKTNCSHTWIENLYGQFCLWFVESGIKNVDLKFLLISNILPMLIVQCETFILSACNVLLEVVETQKFM